MKNFLQFHLLASVGISGLLLASPAYSQVSAPADDDTQDALEVEKINEIVVTARRKEESIQDVPIAITAISSDVLERNSVRAAEDLRSLAPGLNVTGFSRDKAAFYLRGQQQGVQRSGARSESGVATYFAEVPTDVAGPGGFYDLSGVQVLKGPQGTLFGRNTTGGAVLLEPANAQWENGGYAQISYGNYDYKQFNGVLNIAPVPDMLAIRLAGEFARRDGFTKSVITGQKQDDRNYDAFRATIRAVPFEGFENRTIIDYRNKDQNGSGQVISALRGTAALGAPIVIPNFGTVPAGPAAGQSINTLAGLPIGALVPISVGGSASAALAGCLQAALPGCPTGPFGRQIATFAAAYNGGVNPGFYVVAPTTTLNQVLATQATLGPRQNQNNLNTYQRERTIGIVNQTTLDVTDNLRLKNIFSFRKNRAAEVLNFTGTPFAILNNYGPIAGNNWGSGNELLTDEVQLQGSLPSLNLSYVVGGYYETVENGFQSSSIGAQANSFTTEFFNFKDSSRAVFGHLEWSPVEWFGLSGGVRLVKDKRFLAQSRFATTPTATGFTLGACNQRNLATGLIQCPFTNSKSFKATTYDVTANFKPNDDILLYAAYRRGYKAGGLNVPVPPAPAPDVNAFASFEPEFLNDIELGAKISSSLGTVPFTFNLAVFDDKYKNQQVGINTPFLNPNGTISATNIRRNVAESSIRGFEADLSIRPVQGFTVGGFVSHVDAHPTADFIDAAGARVVIKGRQLPGTPRWKYGANIAVDHELAGGNGELIVSADYSWQSKFNSSILPTFIDNKPSYGVANARIGWSGIMGSGIDASFFITNLFDKVYVLGGYPVDQLGFDSSLYGEPRMFGGSIKVRFGSFK